MNPINIEQTPDSPEIRDAIHVAIVSVVAGECLSRAQRVAIDDEGKAAGHPFGIGIVNPFVQKPVNRGDVFWMFMYPGTVDNLRHDWTHPLLKAPGQKYAPEDDEEDYGCRG